MSSVDLPRCQLEGRRTHPLLAFLIGWCSHVGPFWAASIAGHLAVLVVAGLVLGTIHVTRTLTEPSRIVATVDTVLPDEPPLVPLNINEDYLNPPPLEVPPPDLKNSLELADELMQPTAETQVLGVTESGFGQPSTQPPGPDNPRLLAMMNSALPGAPAAGGTGIEGGGLSSGRLELGTRRDRFERFRGPGKGAIIGALDWFKRHQAPDGGWSLGEYTRQCKDTTCTGAGKVKSDPAATAFAILPYLAAGFTHQSKSTYQKSVYAGLFWLVNHQDKASGSLGKTSQSEMYSHGLATICLCEAFGMTKDKQIGAAAQSAVKFIEFAQNKDDGGWRYTPGQAGDTSVTGWHLMALKSAQMAELHVSADVIELGKKYLKAASSKSKRGGLFSYTPDSGPSPTMTAVGLLCLQHMGAKRDDPSLAEGHTYLMRLLPNAGTRNSYYWYYATQVMFNSPGTDWDTWNRAVRRTLIDSQVKEGCAAGSWDPHKPTPDGHAAESGGRMMSTSLAALTLEVYYRFLPLYTLDKKDQARRPAGN